MRNHYSQFGIIILIGIIIIMVGVLAAMKVPTPSMMEWALVGLISGLLGITPPSSLPHTTTVSSTEDPEGPQQSAKVAPPVIAPPVDPNAAKKALLLKQAAELTAQAEALGQSATDSTDPNTQGPAFS